MSTLDELFSRAGASDTDREAWLAERRQGITATEVAKLAKHPGYEAELRKVKAGIETFHGNQYTRWGNLREPVIAAWASGFGLAPETRIFRSALDSRFLASPDMVGEDFDGNIFLGEIKTSRHDLNPDLDYFQSTTYADQMQWQMLVTGAGWCKFIWEQHDDDWPEPQPYPVRDYTIEADPHRQVELVELATRFLEAPAVDADVVIAELAEARLARDEAQQRYAAAEDAARRLFPDGGSSEAALGKLTVSVPKPSARFDGTRFKKLHPEIHKQFLVTSEPGKPRVTFTPAKGISDDGA